MKKIIVIGSSGAGKSCFSRELALLTKIRLFHIDNLYWRADRTHITHEELVCRLNEIMSEKAWIINGNYISTMELILNTNKTIDKKSAQKPYIQSFCLIFCIVFNWCLV